MRTWTYKDKKRRGLELENEDVDETMRTWTWTGESERGRRLENKDVEMD